MTTRPPRSILITGASSGIGAALARAYAANGVSLTLTGRNSDRLHVVGKDCEDKGARVTLETVDVTDKAAMAALIQRIDTERPLDLVIANAGVSAGTLRGVSTITQEDEDLVRDIFSVNLAGVLNTIWPAMHAMTTRRAGQIVIVSSIAGYRGMPSAPAYSASKAAVKTYGEALRPRLAEQGIRLSVVCPGFVESNITAKNTFRMPFFMAAEKAAATIIRGLEKDQGLITFPLPMRLISWIFSCLPSFIAEALGKRLPRKS